MLLCACSGPGQNSSAAPPTVVCGTTISNSASGVGVTDASTQTVTVRQSYSDAIYLEVSSDCDHGITPIFPAAAATLVTEAKAKDGKPAAIVLQAHRKAFDVQVGDHLVRVRLNVLY